MARRRTAKQRAARTKKRSWPRRYAEMVWFEEFPPVLRESRSFVEKNLRWMKRYQPWRLEKDYLMEPLLGGHLHYCPYNDHLPIDDTMEEFGFCSCFNDGAEYRWMRHLGIDRADRAVLNKIVAMTASRVLHS
jgi:hypothetical protein